MRNALIQVRTFLETAPSLKGFILARYGQTGITTNAEIDSFHRSVAASIWHPSCSVQLAANGSTNGVLNSVFQVRGVNHLRVVDASVFVSIFRIQYQLFPVPEAISPSLRCQVGIQQA